MKSFFTIIILLLYTNILLINFFDFEGFTIYCLDDNNLTEMVKVESEECSECKSENEIEKLGCDGKVLYSKDNEFCQDFIDCAEAIEFDSLFNGANCLFYGADFEPCEIDLKDLCHCYIFLPRSIYYLAENRRYFYNYLDPFLINTNIEIERTENINIIYSQSRPKGIHIIIPSTVLRC